MKGHAKEGPQEV